MIKRIKLTINLLHENHATKSSYIITRSRRISTQTHINSLCTYFYEVTSQKIPSPSRRIDKTMVINNLIILESSLETKNRPNIPISNQAKDNQSPMEDPTTTCITFTKKTHRLYQKINTLI